VSDLVQEILRRQEMMERVRTLWEPAWKDVVTYLLPRRGDIYVDNKPQGVRRSTRIFDSTATDAAEILAAALHGMLTNPASPWFVLYTPNRALMQDREVREWLEEATATILHSLAQSNFITRIHEHYLDLVCFGTAFLYVEYDPEHTLNFYAPPPGEMFIAEDRFGRVDTVHRRFTYTARQMVQTWGLEKVSREVQQAYEKEPLRTFTVIHAVFPRKEVKGLDQKGKPYASIYIEEKAKHLLSEGGYNRMPYLCPRWFTLSGETYGYSPGIMAMPDIKMLQQIVKTNLKAQQKAVDPPVQVPDNTVVTRLKLVPGGVNFYRSGSGDRIEPVGAQKSNIPLGLEVEERWRMAIRRKFLNDQLQLMTEKQIRSAAEAYIRKEDQLMILGPIFGRLQAELLDPLIDRVLDILLENNLMPRQPEVLETYEINYVSPIAKAQKAKELASVQRLMEFVSPFVPVNPEILDVLNLDELTALVADDLGVPMRVIRPPEQVQAIREQRRQAAQAAQTVEAATGLSRAVRNVGGVDPENLARMMEVVQGGAPAGEAALPVEGPELEW